jgi:membrane protein implicated in regulation of membrane protease activity
MEIAAHWAWLLAGLALATAEVVAPGFFLIWIGAAAILTGLATLAFGLSLALQFGLFAIAAVAALYAGRRWFLMHPITTSDPLLNDRAARLIGRTVVATEPIVEGAGRVRVGDSIWNASGGDVPAGTRLRVVSVDGGTLIVAPLAKSEGDEIADVGTGDGS